MRPDPVIEVRQAFRNEEDGPLRLRGLKGMHGRTIVLPPTREMYRDPVRLEKRYRMFRKAA